MKAAIRQEAPSASAGKAGGLDGSCSQEAPSASAGKTRRPRGGNVCEDGQLGCDDAVAPHVASSSATRATDTQRMTRIFVVIMLTVAAVALVPAGTRAGDPCGKCSACKQTAAGDETPCGDTGCGPRYCGAVHDESRCPDPCDCSGRWRGCNGTRQGPEKLAPWQLPPGRGFQSGEDVGYLAPRCGGCQTCGPRFPWFF